MFEPSYNVPTDIIITFVKEVLFETLTDREKRIIYARYKNFFGFSDRHATLEELALKEGVSRERIRQIILKGMRKVERKIFIINQSLKSPQVIIKYVEKEDAEKTSNLPIVYKSIETLGEMHTRMANSLLNAEIRTIQQLIEKTEVDLLRLDGFGRVSLDRTVELLASQGLKLKEGENQ